MRTSARHIFTQIFGLALLAAASGSVAELPVKAVTGVETGVTVPAKAAVIDKPAATATAKQKCVARCEVDNGRCNSDVRRGRQECSKKAANSGNNPFTGRPDEGYCGYFTADHCGYYTGNRGACGQRFERRYAECVEWMRGSISAQRFDCFKAESKAQGLCRAELQDCQAECQ